jgi:hypothetical protein
MKFRNTIIKSLMFLAIGLIFIGCRDTKTTEEKAEDTIEKVGDSMEEGAEEVEDAMEDGAEKVEEVIEDKVDSIQQE